MGNSPKGEYMLKKENILKLLGIGIMSLFLLGCAESSFLLTEEESPKMQEVMEDSQIAMDEPVLKNDETAMDELGMEDNQSALEEDVLADNQTVLEETQEIVVHICGAVNNSGVFFLEKGERVYHAIELAGGLRADADGDYINQALLLEDGMKIVIPTKEETKRWKEKEQEAEAKPYEEGEAEMFYVQYAESDSSTVGDEKSGKVNLNTADEKMLCTLPGIGTSRAKSIIDYRTKNGVFKRIEDVMKVSGIKEAAFEKIKDFITVSD